MKSIKRLILVATLFCFIMVANSVVAIEDDVGDVIETVIGVNPNTGETETTESVTDEVPSADIINVDYEREVGGTNVDISFEVNNEGEIEWLNESTDYEDLFNSSKPVPIGYIIIVRTENSYYMILFEGGVASLSDGSELEYDVDDNYFSTSFNLNSSSEIISEVGVFSSFIKMEGFTSFITYSDIAPNTFKPLIAEIIIDSSNVTTGQEVVFSGQATNLAELFSISLTEEEYTYEWDFDDGSTATDDTVTHSYLYPGTYTVELTVSDAEGTKTTTTKQITVSQGSSSNGDTNNGGGSSGDSDPEGNPVMIFVAIIGIIVVIGVVALIIVIRR